MACISKLASAIAYDCDTGATGLVSALIINKEDIASFSTYTPALLLDSFTLKQGASAYKVDTVKRSLTVTSALKVNDGAPNAYTHSATLVVTGIRDTAWRALQSAFTNGSFVVIARPVGETAAGVYGLYYGLSATSVDSSSHDNGGWTSVTLSTPENAVGEDSLMVSASVYDSLYAAAVG